MVLVGRLPNKTPVLATQGKFDEADRLYTQAIKLWENARGPHDQGLVGMLHNRVMLLDKQVREPPDLQEAVLWLSGAMRML